MTRWRHQSWFDSHSQLNEMWTGRRHAGTAQHTKPFLSSQHEPEAAQGEDAVVLQLVSLHSNRPPGTVCKLCDTIVALASLTIVAIVWIPRRLGLQTKGEEHITPHNHVSAAHHWCSLPVRSTSKCTAGPSHLPPTIHTAVQQLLKGTCKYCTAEPSNSSQNQSCWHEGIKKIPQPPQVCTHHAFILKAAATASPQRFSKC